MSRLGRSRLRDAAYRAIWSITQDKLDAVLDFLDARAEGHTLSKAELRARGFTPYVARPFAVGAEEAGKQVAVLPLKGTIAHHAGWEMQASGGTSTVAFGNAFDAAMVNPNVGAIVIDCDSGGGTIEGVAELFAKIYAARGKGKELKAICNAHMHSAALWICSAADEIIITPSGQAGDIGVMTVHTSYAEADAKAGIERKLIKAGKHKGSGFPGEPLSKEDEAAIRANVEAIYSMFVADFAKGRGDSAANVKAGYGEGRSVTAKDAVALGLADRIATFEQVMTELGAKSTPNKTRAGMTSSLVADAGDVQQCPDCGHEMENQDGEMVCPECDAPETEALAELARMAATAFDSGIASAVTASATSLPTIAAAVIPPLTIPKTNELKQEPTVADTPASPTREQILAEVRADEKKRGDAIRALCTDHQLSAKADEYIAAGLTVDAVKDAILLEKKPAVAATRKPISVSAVEQRSDRDPKKGFTSHREFLTAVIENRSRDLSQVKDERLRALAQRDADDDAAGGEVAYMLPTGLVATVGSDEQGNYSNAHGGFLGNGVTRLPGMLQVGFDGNPLAGRTQDVPMATTTIEIPARVDKDHTTSVSGGFTVARRAETAAQTASRLAMELVTLRASSLFGFAYATEELLTDSPISFAAIIESGFRDQFGAHLLNETLTGLGDGEYMGVLNAGATVSIAKESNQTAATIVTANVTKMRARSWGYGNAVWIANQDTYPQLASLSVGVGTAGALVYQTSVVEDRPDMLLGRPIFYNEFAKTLGTVGDIMLLNMSQYLEGTYQPLQSAESIHVRFLNHERAFKFWTRNAGQPWWRSALTPKNSTATLSPFVTLATRA